MHEGKMENHPDSVNPSIRHAISQMFLTYFKKSVITFRLVKHCKIDYCL